MNEKHFLITFEEKWSANNKYYLNTVINAVDLHTAIQNFWQNKPKHASWRILAISELPEDYLKLPLYKPSEDNN